MRQTQPISDGAQVQPEGVQPAGGTGRKVVGAFSLVLALGSLVAIAFVLTEPIRAYESLSSELTGYGYDSVFSPAELQSMMAGRMREAAFPLWVGSGASLLGVALAWVGRRGSVVAKIGLSLSLLALVGAGYVWFAYGDKILSAGI